MRPLADYPISELKLVYRVLHKSLMQELELMDADLLADLQAHLRERAAGDGVDTSDHGAWDAWLGNAAVSCETRVADRKRLTLVDGGLS